MLDFRGFIHRCAARAGEYQTVADAAIKSCRAAAVSADGSTSTSAQPRLGRLTGFLLAGFAFFAFFFGFREGFGWGLGCGLGAGLCGVGALADACGFGFAVVELWAAAAVPLLPDFVPLLLPDGAPDEGLPPVSALNKS